MARRDRGTRICVVGAGAAGLTAAHLLAKKGYRRIVVLEKHSQVGGKCCTIELDGRTYELGAVGHNVGYTTVREIMRDVGVRSTSAGRNAVHVDFQRGTYQEARCYLPVRRWLSLGLSPLALVREFRKHRRILRPGFTGLDTFF